MKISLNWLKDYIKFSGSLEDLTHRLTMAGQEVESVTNLNGDVIIEMEVTPNRPDCLGLKGIAREVAALHNKPLKEPKIWNQAFPARRCDVFIEDKEACSRYLGVLIEDTVVKDASSDIRKRLESLGNRAINNAVDITNFCLFELGQPMHIFDYDKLAGGKIIVRKARKGEKIVTLDNVERELEPSVLVIADEKRPVAIAGIMGGRDTEVTTQTKNVFLECAHFHPVLIRRTARALGLSSDSSYRFERGVDEASMEASARRALYLLEQEAGGRVTAFRAARGQSFRPKPRAISVKPKDIQHSLGAEIPSTRMKTALTRLGCVVSGTRTSWQVTPPTFRFDLKQPVDLVEEIARISGYDQLPQQLPVIRASSLQAPASVLIKSKLASIMAGQGFSEIKTYSLIHPEALSGMGFDGEKAVSIRNPISGDHKRLRPSFLPSVFPVIQLNVNRGRPNLHLFETGRVYSQKGETDRLAVVMTGQVPHDWRSPRKRVHDIFDLKGALNRMFEACAGMPGCFEPEDHPAFETGRGMRVTLKGKSIGIAGELRLDLLESRDIRVTPVLFAEIDTDSLAKFAFREKIFKPFSDFPAVVRDVSLSVPRDVSYKKIEEAVSSAAPGFLHEIVFIEQYLGEKISKDRKGLVFSLVYRSAKRTLTEDEVQKAHEQVISSLIGKCDATIR